MEVTVSFSHLLFFARRTMMLVGISSFWVLDLLGYIFMFPSMV